MKVRGFISVLALLGCIGAYAAPKEHGVSAKIAYPVGKTEVNQDYRSNGKAVSTLDNVLGSGASVSRIEVISSSSPEGPYERNVRLTQERSKVMVDYMYRVFPDLKEKITVNKITEAWDNLMRVENNQVAAELLEISEKRL